MTALYYNGVLLRDCTTESFTQKIEYDSSNTDVMFSRFRVRVSSTLVSFVDAYPVDHVKTVRPDPNNPTAGTLPERIRRVQTLLGQKGGLFYYYIPNAPGSGSLYPASQHSDVMLSAVGAVLPNGNAAPETIPIHPDDPDGPSVYSENLIDNDNGPSPLDVSVVQIFGGRSLRVEFEIEVCRRLCDPAVTTDPYPSTEPNISPTAGVEGVEDDPETPEDETVEAVEADAGAQITPSSLVLSNRWNVAESKDATWVTTRVLQGTLRVKNKKIIPHLMRFLVVPPLLKGYQRTSQHFADDPTGLTLKYRIEDKERSAAPPAPAIDWDGEYIESAGALGIHNQVSALSVRLIGPPNVNKQDLIGAAGRVIDARISGIQKVAGQGNTSSEFLIDVAVAESLAEPVITMRVRVQRFESQTKLRVRLDQIGKPLSDIDGYSPDKWPVPLLHDSSSPAGVLSCYLQNPCSRWHGVVGYPEPTVEAKEGVLSASDPNYQGSEFRLASTDRDEEDKDEDVRVYPSEEPFTDDVTALAYSQTSTVPYTYVSVRSRYVTDHGWASIPLATNQAASNTVEQIRLHGGKTKRVLEVEVARIDESPKLPMPVEDTTDTNGIREVLIDSAFESLAPKIMPDGVSREHRLLARYEYSLSRPLTVSESMRRAISPVDATASETRLLDLGAVFSNSLYT